MDIFVDRPFGALFEKYREQPRIRGIARLESLSRERFLRDVEPAGYPVVIRGSGPPLRRDELVARLLENCGEAELTVRFGDYADPASYVERREVRKETLATFLPALLRDPRPADNAYAGNQCPSAALLAALDARPPAVYPVEQFETPALWLGGATSVTPLHKDGSDNFATHLFGRKKWTLFPVRDAALLYMKRILPASDFAVSAVDVRQPDLERFPLFMEAERVEVVLEAGETLYLPRGWGHFIENLEPTLMVNFWIREDRKPAPAAG